MNENGKVPWDVGRDGVVVGVDWGVRGREKKTPKMYFGGATVLLQ